MILLNEATMKRLLVVLLTTLLFTVHFSIGFIKDSSSEPSKHTLPSDARERMQSWDYHKQMAGESIFKNLQWRSLGPTFMGGRISSIKGVPGKSSLIYVAAGSGNLWKTENNGTTWEPIFDHESAFSIGDIAVAGSNPDILWIGSGEELTARSSFAGTGVFKSIDAGRTWQNMGLNDTQHIGRIIIDYENPDIVYVAAIGHNYSFNEERGLFKTNDGGKTWKKVLYVSDKAGCVDVIMDPSDSRILYAATWERDRKPWINVQSGEGSGIYKTTDAGATWKKLMNGLPIGKHMGKIGLAVCASNPEIVYALLDNHAPRMEPPNNEDEASVLTIDRLEKLTKDEFLSLDKRKLDDFLESMGVPAEYTAEAILSKARKGEVTAESLANYLLELWPDRKQFMDVIGGEVYRSRDKGETWTKMNEYHLESFFNNYGYAFCDIRVSPDNENEIFILGVRLLRSINGGKTFTQIGKKGVHADHHELWIDPRNPDRLLNGNDGGLNFSYDRGETWQRIDNLPIGEFYTISVDLKTPYNIYGGLQDTGVVYGPSNDILEQGVEDPWRRISGGDGMFAFVDPADSDTVYYGLQFGRLFRKKLSGTDPNDITPKAKIGEPALRYNWMTPFIISPHNPLTLYYGANRLFKSLNKGDKWFCLSPDLSTNPGPEKQGDIPYGTITTISESALKPGLIYIGTDDGNVQLTHNDGVTWTGISKGLPKKWVSRVVASQYDESIVFVSMTGYREDDFNKYLYMSTDFGETWESIAGNLPAEPINVIREDPNNKNILFVGTDLGAYVSLDRGKNWHSLNHSLPTAAVHDLIVHPRENELIIGTHGRSVYKLDVEYIQQYTNIEELHENYLFRIKPATLPRSRGYKGEWAQERLREGFIYYYLRSPTENVKIIIRDHSGKLIKNLIGTKEKGINVSIWDLTFEGGREIGKSFASSGEYVEPGSYRVEISAGESRLEGTIEVKPPSL
jgi:photosystem II stability/assembly factor-like uncharacterized protein